MLVLIEREHEVRLVEIITKVLWLAAAGPRACLNTPNMQKGLCRGYFTAEMTQFKYRCRHSPVMALLLIYHN